MLSILIPCFRSDVRSLVEVLLKECSIINLPYEILLGDDGNNGEWSVQIHNLTENQFVSSIRSEENIGRARIRNLLAYHAKYAYLLFLDADVLPMYEDFIQRYFASKDIANVVCGGRVYEETPPAATYQFHWHYGRHREAQSASVRNERGWKGFQTNNFLIRKECFDRIKFDHHIQHYGHEDTLFGYYCDLAGFSIAHIDNPAIHKGLDDHTTFRYKIDTGVKTLLSLVKENEMHIRKDDFSQQPIHQLSKYTRLSKTAELLKKNSLDSFARIIFFIMYPIFILNFKSKRPNLHILDLYKLGYYMTLYKRGH